MPCCLFTYHAYGSWMPNRRQGYVKRGRGVLPPDKHMARLYVEAMNETAVEFDEQLQRLAITVLLESEPLQRFELYFVATDGTHIHSLFGWRDVRTPVDLRSRLKGSITRSMNRAGGRRSWLSEGGSRKQVNSAAHFDYLLTTYLPKHLGWKWDRRRGMFL